MPENLNRERVIVEILMKNPNEITPYKNNPRDNESAVKPVADSIQQFGFRVPILLDEDGVIVAGDTRRKAAILLGLQEVPCISVGDLTPEQVKAFRIADNKTSEYAEWDFDALALEMDELQKAGFDLAFTAFASDEISTILDALEPPRQIADDDFDEEIDPTETPYTQPGDIWAIGNHRLMCGDSTSAEHVTLLMMGESADLAVTDPPYNVSYEGKTADRMKIQNDSMCEDDFEKFLLSAHRNLYANMKDGAGIYVFHADSAGLQVRGAFCAAGFKLAQCCIWVKNSMVLGRQDYQWQHEPVLYGWKPTGTHRWCADRCQTTIWNFDRPTRSAEHPTMKPIPLIAYPVQNSSKKGDLVLDLFGGSGTTLMACEKTDRRCYTMEIDPLYCDVIVRRYIQSFGNSGIQLNRADKIIDFDSISQSFRL